MEPKPVRQSKVVWLNSLVTALGVIVTAAPEVAPMFGPKAGLVLLVSGIANILLRFLTKQPIAFGAETPSN